MAHITIQDLAKGIITTISKKDEDQLRKTLVTQGSRLAVAIACELVEDKTGLPSEVCVPVGEAIVKNLRKAVRSRFRS